jgi:hypothetical protein
MIKESFEERLKQAAESAKRDRDEQQEKVRVAEEAAKQELADARELYQKLPGRIQQKLHAINAILADENLHMTFQNLGQIAENKHVYMCKVGRRAAALPINPRFEPQVVSFALSDSPYIQVGTMNANNNNTETGTWRVKMLHPNNRIEEDLDNLLIEVVRRSYP